MQRESIQIYCRPSLCVMMRASWKVLESEVQGIHCFREDNVEVVVVIVGLRPQQWLSAA
jgi:hypothetical protein